MKNIAYFGGAFDPMTLSHVRIIKKILDLDIIDEIWVTPCYISYHGKAMTNSLDRLNMCELSIKEIDRVKVFSFEIKNKLIGESFDIIKKLLKDYSEFNFYFVIGLDNADTIYNWSNWDKLINLVPFIVLPRGIPQKLPNKQWYKEKPHIYLKDFELDFGSSTDARKDFREKKYPSNVDPKVVDYAIKNKLYI